MQDFGMRYNTPTLGLSFGAPDYIEFLSNLKYYFTEAKIQFVSIQNILLETKEEKKGITGILSVL
jgi:uncharacterized protein (DUF1919 family)